MDFLSLGGRNLGGFLEGMPPSDNTEQEGAISQVSDGLRSCLQQIDKSIRTQEADLVAFNSLIADYRQHVGSAKPDIDRILRYAVLVSSLRHVGELVDKHGANLSQADTLGRPAIFYLAPKDDLDVARYTINRTCQDAGVDALNHRDTRRTTALEYAVDNEAQDMVALLFAWGADLNISPYYFTTKRDHNVIRVLGMLKLARLRHDMPLTISQYNPVIGVKRLYQNSAAELQPRLECGEEHITHALHDTLTWVHCPSTNGGLLYTVMKSILRDPEVDKARRHMESFFFQSFRYPSTLPNDPMLMYREPFYRSVEQSSKTVSCLVFPCLVMHDIKQQADRRTAFEVLDKQIADEQKYMNRYIRRYMHLERTLDEAYYPGLSRKVLSDRNKEQVIFREYSAEEKAKKGTPILMVPQLWIWRFDRCIISAHSLSDMLSFLQVGPLDQLEPCFGADSRWGFGLVEPKRQIGLTVADCIDRFGRPQTDAMFPPPLQIFEAGVANIRQDVLEYMSPAGTLQLDITKEREFLNRISDIQGELAMIQDVLGQQREVLEDILNDPPSDFVHRSQQEGDAPPDQWDIVIRSQKTLDKYYKLTEKISADAARIEKNIQDELNLKRTFATMDDARTSLSLGIAAIAFTVITVIFAPLAFVTALFALPIDDFEKKKVKITTGSPEEGKDAFTRSYIGKWFATAELVALGITGLVVLTSLWWLDSRGKNKGVTKTREKEPKGAVKMRSAQQPTKPAFSWSWKRTKNGNSQGSGTDSEKQTDSEQLV